MNEGAPGLRQRAGSWLGAVRTRGLLYLVRAGLLRLGFRCFWFYWVEESIPADAGTTTPPLPDGFRIAPIGADEVAIISRWDADGAPFIGAEMRQNFANGAQCLGIMRGDEIVGFSWYELDYVASGIWQVELQPNEAYLFNMYIRPEMRGRQFAPILRHHTYRHLAELGRDTCFSITAVSNKSSWRFKEKLGARKVFTGLHLESIGKWRRSWVVRREK